MSPDGQVVHHALHVLGDFGLPADDELVADIEKPVQMARDFEREFGLYCSALAAVGHLTPDLRRTLITRLANHAAVTDGDSLRSPYDRRTLERLLAIEAVTVGAGDSLTAGEADVLLASIDDILADDLRDARPHDRTYPLFLRHCVDGSTDPSELHACFDAVIEQHEAGQLVYRDLKFDSLVLLNAARCRGALTEERYSRLWAALAPLLDDRQESKHDHDADTLAQHPAHLAALGPYVRARLHTPDDQPRLPSELTLATGSAEPRARALSRARDREMKALRTEQALVEALSGVLPSTLEIEARVEPLGGGMTASGVYVATLDIRQPFRISGVRLVFKTGTSIRERGMYEQLKELGLGRLFARVLSDPAVVKVAGEDLPMFVYEHLESMVTLRSALQRPQMDSDKRALLTAVTIELAPLWRDHSRQRPSVDDFKKPVRDRLMHTAADIRLLSIPNLKTELQHLSKETQELAARIDIPMAPHGSVVHGDLNCRNIMLRAAGGDIESIKLIDYETLSFLADPLIDIGELIEDAHQAAGFPPLSRDAERAVLEGAPQWIRERLETPEGQIRLALARLLSCCYLVKAGFSGDPAQWPGATRTVTRWASLLNQLTALVGPADEQTADRDPREPVAGD